MTVSIRQLFEVLAYAITITAVLAIAVLAARLGASLAITIAMAMGFLCALAMVATTARRRVPVSDGSSLSIQDELERRKLRSPSVSR
jgi:hypothetical protein